MGEKGGFIGGGLAAKVLSLSGFILHRVKLNGQGNVRKKIASWPYLFNACGNKW
jgi:hypothetical protein